MVNLMKMSALAAYAVLLLVACSSSPELSSPTGENGGINGVGQPPINRDQAHRRWGYIETPKGDRLRWVLYTPTEDGEYPVLVEYDGYSAGSGHFYSDADYWLSNGYGILGLSVPGSNCSTGEFLVFHPSWGEAGAYAIDWIAEQEWSDGNVGMTGFSFSGYMQLWAAVFSPTALKAISPALNTTDPYRDVGYPGGIFNQGFPPLWWAGFSNTWINFGAPAARDIDGDDSCTQTAAENSVKMNQPEYNMPALLASNPYYDSLYPERSARLYMDGVNVPVLGAEAWQDEQVGSRNGYYEELVAPEDLWMVGMSGDHVGILSLPYYREMRLRFFDHYVKGIENGWESTPRVTVLNEVARDENNDLQPRFVSTSVDYPVTVTPTRYYFGSGGSLGTLPETEGSDSYNYPVPGPVANNPIGSNGEEWAVPTPEGGALVYTTAPLEEDMSFHGPASADIWFSSTSVDSDLQLTLTEVRPDGQEMYVQRGWLRASHADLDVDLTTELRPWHSHEQGTQSLLVPNEPRLVRVEINKFTHHFRAGSKLRLIIDAPSRTGYWDFARIDTPAVNTVLHGGAQASSLVLGRWNLAEPVPQELPACGSLKFQPCRPDAYPAP